MSDTGYHEPVRVPGSFDAFYRSEYPGVAALLYTLTGSKWVADDLAQEAFLRAHRDWDEVGRMEFPGRWARRVGINLAMSRFRRLRAETQALLKLGRPPTSIDAPLEPEFEEFWAQVRYLPRRQRQVIALYYVDDLSVADIADVLGIADGTVKANLHKARTNLEGRLSDSQWWAS